MVNINICNQVSILVEFSERLGAERLILWTDVIHHSITRNTQMALLLINSPVSSTMFLFSLDEFSMKFYKS